MPPAMLRGKVTASWSGPRWSCRAVSATRKSTPRKTPCGRTAWPARPRALKEHFILERIAEEEEIDVAEDDYEAEIRLIAAQGNESPAARAGPPGKERLDGRAAETIVERK